MSLSLFAAFALSDPQKVFLMVSLPYNALNLFWTSSISCSLDSLSELSILMLVNGYSVLATSGSLFPMNCFHLTIGLSSLTSSYFSLIHTESTLFIINKTIESAVIMFFSISL
jgi:hypothetical protein